MWTRMLRAAACACALMLALGSPLPLEARDDGRDRVLASQVQEALRQSGDIDLQQIRVEVHDRVVELSGHASSSAQMSKIVDLAQGVEGVKDVRNSLRIKPPQPAPP